MSALVYLDTGPDRCTRVSLTIDISAAELAAVSAANHTTGVAETFALLQAQMRAGAQLALSEAIRLAHVIVARDELIASGALEVGRGSK